MDSSIKWIALIGGGYLVAKYFGIDPLSFLHTSAPAASTTTSTQSTEAMNTLALVAQKMQQSGQDPTAYYDVDVFNYYYKAVRGVSGPDAHTLFPGNDPNKLYSINEWWGAMTGQGFSGFGNIANRVNPYLNPKGTPFGSNIRANGSEMLGISFN